MEQQPQQDMGIVELNWSVPEYEKPERDRRWYIVASIIAVILLIYAYFTANFLFMGIILLGAFVLVITEGQEAPQVEIGLTDEGIIVGRKFYDYDELRNFAVLYKPNQGAKHLYFEFKSAIKQRLSISLMDQDPLKVRQHLLKYLPEDLERTNQPLSENLSRLLKL